VCSPDDPSVALPLLDGGHELLFIGTRGGMEAEVIARTHIPLAIVSSGPMSRTSLTRAVGGLAASAVGTAQALPIVKRFKPDVVIATGGYTSVPAVMAAATLRTARVLRGTKIALIEPNVEPGRANRLMANVADEVWGAYAETGKFFPKKFVLTGIPVRAEIAARPTQVEARRSLGLDPKLTTVLIFGGSQGSRTINVATSAMIARRRLPRTWQVLHASGERDHEWMKAERKVETSGNRYHLVKYLDDMALAYAAADVAVCRAGASTLAELAAVGLPSILIPYPHAADDHQRKNARLFAGHNAAVVIEDTGLDPDSLYWALVNALDPDKNVVMRLGAAQLAHPRALDIMIERIIKGKIGTR